MTKAAVLLVALAGGLACQGAQAQDAAQERPGPLADGGFLLNSGWKIHAAGQEVPIGTFPMRSALSNDGKYLLALNGGIEPPSISVIDIAARKEVGRTVLPDAWLGLAVAPTGDLVYVGGGSTGKVFELTLDSKGSLTRTREFSAAATKAAGSPFVGDVTLSPDGRVLYAADLYGDTINNINLQSGKTVDHWKTGRRPYRILVSPNGAQLLISSLADGMVYEHGSTSGILTTKLRVGSHPTDMLWLDKPVPTENGGTNYPARLFVAAANSNNVFSFGITADGQFTTLDTINVAMTPMHPLGMTPSALAVDRQGTRLYVVCSDANLIAVADLSTPHPGVLGMIPTGRYPTAVQAVTDDQLAVVNGKTPDGKYPEERGAVEFLASPATPDDLRAMTETALDNSPYRDQMIYGAVADETEAYFAKTQEHPSPIQHVIYVIKGSQTYDSVLGDLAKGNSDKSLVRFGESITPNLHKLAREFVLYDNFYSNGDAVADGQNWATAAIAPDYTAKLWASAQAGRSKISDFEGGEPANTPPAGYLWSNALQAGLTVRDFGEWTSDSQIDPSLANHTDRNFGGVDPNRKDTDRANEFIREWKSFDANGQAPQLSIVRLSNDEAPHGAAPIQVSVIDNDNAIGLLAEAVSQSKLWPSTAIFIIQAAPNGLDHIDSHRTPTWVISPFTRRGSVDSTMYNQVGVLRTIELILGLRPMTHFDAGARPLFGSFSSRTDNTPFSAVATNSR
ncbi:MAG: beta-propeller fold lactonase family protein [Acidobacteriota bacterium]|nr:beta-propeller fold lactonase family protein [Acidobacteriota bacterium]